MPKKTEKMPVEEIPLPPDDPDFDEAVEDGEAVGATGQEDAPAASPEPDPEPDLDYHDLDFEDDGRVRVPLKRSFRRDGEPVKEVYCDHLPLGAVINLTRRSRRPNGIERADIYAAIAGMEVEEFLGLKDVDGYAVMEAAEPFMPRAFRGDPKAA